MALFRYRFIIKSLLLFHLFRICLFNDTISPTSSLKDGDLLISNGGICALGFFSPGNSRFRYLGIWYYQVTDQTVLWVANRNNPINSTSGILSFSNEGNLVLYPDNQTASPVWSTNVSVSGTKSCLAQLLDSGNFVLVQNDSTRTLMWQSFDHPTNTWLPFMRLGLDLKTGLNRFLTSWKSADDPATGNYSFRIDPTGSPQMSSYKGSAKFWRGGSWTGRRFSGVPEMTYNYVFNISFVNNDTEVYLLDIQKDPKIITRETLNEYGIVQWFTWSPTHHTWIEYFSAPKEQCDYYNHCGSNGYCKPDQLQNFECECLPGFKPKSPREWLLRDGSGGCVRNYMVSMCQSGEGFVKLEHVKVPDTSAARVHMSLGLKQCEEECLRNCSCMAYASAYAETNEGEGSGCLTWHGHLVDTRTYYIGFGQDLFVRVGAAELARHRKRRPFGKKGVLVAIIVSAVAIFFMSAASFCFLWRMKGRRGGGKNSTSFIASFLFLECSFRSNELEEDKADIPLFDFSTIATATEYFSSNNKLGQGGFGPVYKGVLSNGKEIAVKRLSKYSGQGKEEFQNEITLIAKLQHRNLVKILGCCIQGEEKMLIYEYLPNKSLDSFIFEENKNSLLDWEKRMDIALGRARGILYLYQDSRLRIIHRDLKASNVLLDEALNPKISDFGMARIFKGNQHEANTSHVVGTYGYMSPEYAMQGLFSIKSDVYSFGVLLLEIITARRNNGHYSDNPTSHLVGHVWDLWREGKALEIVDPSLGESYPMNQVEKCIQIGLLCVQEHATDRPTMSNVVFMLENGFDVATPKQPAFVMKRSFYSEDHIGSSTERATTRPTSLSPPPVQLVELFRCQLYVG